MGEGQARVMLLYPCQLPSSRLEARAEAKDPGAIAGQAPLPHASFFASRRPGREEAAGSSVDRAAIVTFPG